MVKYDYDRYGRPIHWSVEWKNFEDEHRGDLFHSTVGIHECTSILRTCNLIIDHKATINLVSAEVVDNFKLPIITHPYPYRFRWFKDGAKVKVTKQVLIHLKLGNFTDKVLCDIVPMKVHHLLLGMPWLDERGVMYDGSSTRCYININGTRTRFTSMTQEKAFQTHKEQEVRDVHRENALREETKKKATNNTLVVDSCAPVVELVCANVGEVVHTTENDVGIHVPVVNNVVIASEVELAVEAKRKPSVVEEIVVETEFSPNKVIEIIVPDVAIITTSDELLIEAEVETIEREVVPKVDTFIAVTKAHEIQHSDTINAAPMMLIADLDIIAVGDILKHEFVDPYLVQVDAYNNLHFYVASQGVIPIYIQPRAFSHVSLVKHGAHHIFEKRHGTFLRINFDPGIILRVNVEYNGVRLADADFYDIILIRGRIIFNRERMI